MDKTIFWTLIAAPFVVGIILLTIEYFVLQPLVKWLAKRPVNNNQNSKENNSQTNSTSKKTTLKERFLKLWEKFVNSSVLRKVIVAFASVPPKFIGIALSAFCLGIVFTIAAAQITHTDLSYRIVFPTATPLPTATPTQHPESELLRRSAKEYSDIFFLVDITGSMTEQKINAISKALFDFEGKLLDKDRIGIILFNDKSELKLPLTSMQSNANEIYKVTKEINYAIRDSGSALYDTILFTLEQYNVDGEGSRNRIMIIITDGEDNRSDYPLPAVINSINNRPDVLVIPIALGSEADVNSLEAIAKASGSKLYLWDENQNNWWINEIMNTYMMK